MATKTACVEVREANRIRATSFCWLGQAASVNHMKEDHGGMFCSFPQSAQSDGLALLELTLPWIPSTHVTIRPYGHRAQSQTDYFTQLAA